MFLIFNEIFIYLYRIHVRYLFTYIEFTLVTIAGLFLFVCDPLFFVGSQIPAIGRQRMRRLTLKYRHRIFYGIGLVLLYFKLEFHFDPFSV